MHYFEDAHLDKRAAPPRAAAPFGAGPGFAPPPFAPGLPPPSEPLAPMALDGPTSSDEELRLFLSDGELLGAMAEAGALDTCRTSAGGEFCVFTGGRLCLGQSTVSKVGEALLRRP